MNFRTALILVIAALIFIPALAEATSLSSLTAATGSNNIDNGTNVQIWSWNTLISGPGLELATSGTAAGTAGSEVLKVASTGTNSQSGVPTMNAYFGNLTTGTDSTNYGLYAEADSASTNNYAVYGVVNVTNVQGAPNAGDSGVWGVAIGTTAATYGVRGTNHSATGYGGYFDNVNGGYPGLPAHLSRLSRCRTAGISAPRLSAAHRSRVLFCIFPPFAFQQRGRSLAISMYRAIYAQLRGE